MAITCLVVLLLLGVSWEACAATPDSSSISINQRGELDTWRAVFSERQPGLYIFSPDANSRLQLGQSGGSAPSQRVSVSGRTSCFASQAQGSGVFHCYVVDESGVRVTHRVRSVDRVRTDPVAIRVELASQVEESDSLITRWAYGFERDYVIQNDALIRVAEALDQLSDVVLVRRHLVFIVAERSSNLEIQGNPVRPGVIGFPLGTEETMLTYSVLPLQASALRDTDFEGVLYEALWKPLATLAIWLELLLEQLSTHVGMGSALILLAIIIRIATLPLNLWGARNQLEFEKVSSLISAETKAIKSESRGAEQSERILSVYKKYGVSPMSGLKGSAPLLVQIPILIAIYNITAESFLLHGQSFLWIENLSHGDRLMTGSMVVPLFGASLNVLPVALGALIVLMGYAGRSPGRTFPAGATVVAVLIVGLCYSLSAGLMLYWITSNCAQLLERFYFVRN